MSLRDEFNRRIVEKTIDTVYPPLEEKMKAFFEKNRQENSEMFMEAFSLVVETLEKQTQILQKILDAMISIKETNEKIHSLKYSQLKVEGKLLGENIINNSQGVKSVPISETKIQQ